ncbi:alpha/beta hydrolase [Actinocorallia longicatena]|uniref:Alpha/beta hydrolase n=1 Tax=Actinocorallia longicatena TaxID=111803 RepID=A0ABP6QM14_9ACTN
MTSSEVVHPPVPFDPELAAALELLRGLMPERMTIEAVHEMRRLGATMPQPDLAAIELQLEGAYTLEERFAPGPEGDPEVPVLVCRPSGAAGPVPGIYFVHGGGMVLGDNRTGLLETLALAGELKAAVVSVDYRLAPEHPHPAPVEDCYAGLLWTAENAAELGVDPGRLVIAGTSAGGGLAAAVALLARDRGGPALAGQLLACPMLDDRNDTPSALQMAGLGVWDRTANDTGWTALLGEARGTDAVSPYAAPARATDLSGLPPAFIDVGSAETFRDEDVAYASRIWQAGGAAELHVWPGGFHGFDMMAPHAALSREARQARAAWLRRVLGD